MAVTPYISQILDTDYQESVLNDSAIVILDVKKYLADPSIEMPVLNETP